MASMPFDLRSPHNPNSQNAFFHPYFSIKISSHLQLKKVIAEVLQHRLPTRFMRTDFIAVLKQYYGFQVINKADCLCYEGVNCLHF